MEQGTASSPAPPKDSSIRVTLASINYVKIVGVICAVLTVGLMIYGVGALDSARRVRGVYADRMAKLANSYQTELNRQITEVEAIYRESCKSEALLREHNNDIDYQNLLLKAIRKLQPKISEGTAKEIVSAIIFESKSKNFDPAIIAAIIKVESDFNPFAMSGSKAIGLMQIKYEVWADKAALKDNGVNSKDKLYWIDLNIKCGTSIFASHYEESGQDLVKALYQYNTGKNKLPKGTSAFKIDYVNRVVITAYIISDFIRSHKN